MDLFTRLILGKPEKNSWSSVDPGLLPLASTGSIKYLTSERQKPTTSLHS